MRRTKDDLARIVISILGLCGLIVAVFWIVRPFLSSMVWAILIAVATWPLLIRAQRLLWNKRGLAAALMVLALFVVALLPFLAAVRSLVKGGGALGEFATNLPTYHVPPPPAFLEKVPVAGPKLQEKWTQVAAEGTPGLLKRITPYLGGIAKWFASRVGSFGVLLAQFLLTLVLTAVFYVKGEEAVAGLKAFSRKLLGARGEGLVDLSGGAIRAVAMGVVVTALVQSLAGGIGLAVVGTPFAAPLTAGMFILCIAQLGPGFILVPATVWTYLAAGPVRGTVLLVWTLVVVSMDNVIRPLLIRKGIDLSLLLVFAGVIGGLMSLGLIGIFVGPVVLAVARTLMKAWLEGGEDEEEASDHAPEAPAPA